MLYLLLDVCVFGVDLVVLLGYKMFGFIGIGVFYGCCDLFVVMLLFLMGGLMIIMVMMIEVEYFLLL